MTTLPHRSLISHLGKYQTDSEKPLLRFETYCKVKLRSDLIPSEASEGRSPFLKTAMHIIPESLSFLTLLKRF